MRGGSCIWDLLPIIKFRGHAWWINALSGRKKLVILEGSVVATIVFGFTISILFISSNLTFNVFVRSYNHHSILSSATAVIKVNIIFSQHFVCITYFSGLTTFYTSQLWLVFICQSYYSNVSCTLQIVASVNLPLLWVDKISTSEPIKPRHMSITCFRPTLFAIPAYKAQWTCAWFAGCLGLEIATGFAGNMWGPCLV